MKNSYGKTAIFGLVFSLFLFSACLQEVKDFFEEQQSPLQDWYAVSDKELLTDWLYDVCYGGGKFVAVGGKQPLIVWSADGVEWIRVFLNKLEGIPNDNNGNEFKKSGYFRTVCYNEQKNLYVAAGSHGYVFWSQDGKTWTKADSKLPVTETVYSVDTGNGVFVCGASNGQIIYSDNGKNWNLLDRAALYSVFSGRSINRVHFDGTRFFATTSTGKIAASTRGTTVESWYTGGSSGFEGYEYAGVDGIWSNGTKVMAGSNNGFIAYYPAFFGAGEAAYSGFSMTPWSMVLDGSGNPNPPLGQSSRGAIFGIYDVTYAHGTWFVCGTDGKVAYSADNGVTWKQVKDSKRSGMRADAFAANSKILLTVGRQGRISYCRFEFPE
ncbi:MAG: hypothetical protein Ta2A_00810 [Treponemataceae bacterium]|nr:MAG: hypothetical protein Ta2A_00810 [Treponemataceae bacterium]